MEERLYHMLAGYQALLEARTYNPNTHTQEYYKYVISTLHCA